MTDAAVIDPLGGHVTVERRFQRSIRLDADLGTKDALRGYVVHQSARAALETTASLVAKHQGAFTWTGPYGGGKSSLALALASCLLPDEEPRQLARGLIGDALGPAFEGAPGEWLPVVLTGRRGDPVTDLREAVATAVADAPGKARTKRSKTEDASGRDVIDRLSREADVRVDGGVLVVIDEMGKYLEGAGDRSVDIHFFQDLAEAANRSDGRLIVIGILHQAFERYAERLGSKVQDEWAKIQGRYVDVPIVTAIDEVIDLLGRAVETDLPHPKSAKVAKAVATAIATRRPGTPDDLADRLDACWPLHPVTAALLGPVTRRRFGQNERSLFGFLGSAEPGGFQDFLAHADAGALPVFEPAGLWDYLRLNLEPAIQASPDGHRWAQASEAVERSQRFGTELHERMAKTVALIDLFRNGSGIAASEAILATCGGGAHKAAVKAALSDLAKASALVFRRHLDAYAIYAGSDFDIEAEVASRMEAAGGVDVRALNDLAGLRPVVAKAHHYRTGTPRWFAAGLIGVGAEGIAASDFAVPKDAAGRFVLAIPTAELSDEEAEAVVMDASGEGGDLPVVVGLPPNGDEVRALGRELTATRDVQRDSPELEGDATARREVEARISILTAQLEEALRVAFDEAPWFLDGEELAGSERSMSRLASDLADQTFRLAPIIHSELVNRQRPSSNSNAAIRALLTAITEGTGQKHFGMDGYPPEVGLAETVLVATGLYEADGDDWMFAAPDGTNDQRAALAALWSLTDDTLASGEAVPIGDVYDAWTEPPYGVRRGVMPILIVAYLITRKVQTAVYVDGMFQPAVTDLVMDRLLQNPAEVALRRVVATKADRQALKLYAEAAERLVGWRPPAEPLPVAQALVEFVFKLPGWARHARSTISEAAVDVRHALMHADDPHDLFGRTLPDAVGTKPKDAAEAVCAALDELHASYPAMLDGLRSKMLSGLKHRGEDLEPLRARAAAIGGGAGDDLKLSGFVTRLTTFEGTTKEMEAICGLVTGQPVTQWRDLEPPRAAVQLADYAYRFRRLELFGDAGDAPTQTAVMMMAGVGDAEKSVVRRAQVSVADQEELRPLAADIKIRLAEAGLDQDHLLAVLADVAHDLLVDDGEEDVSVPLADTTNDEASA